MEDLLRREVEELAHLLGPVHQPDVSMETHYPGHVEALHERTAHAVELVDHLNRGGRVVDARRERSLRDVDELADTERGVLEVRPVLLDDHGPSDPSLRTLARRPAPDPDGGSAFHHEGAHGMEQLDNAVVVVRPLREPSEVDLDDMPVLVRLQLDERCVTRCGPRQLAGPDGHGLR